jgi:hypothetical protein
MTYPLDKSGNETCILFQGSWNVKDGIASFTSSLTNTISRYNRQALELAIQNVKNTRSSYKTYDAYIASLFHFQSGLSMLNARTGLKLSSTAVKC